MVGVGNVDAERALEAFNANNLFDGPQGRIEVEDISAMVLFLCLPSGSKITGQAIPIDAGWTAS